MKKRKYLYRLITIIVFLLIIPMTLFFDLLWKKSFDELEGANEVYYNKVLKSYVSFFDDLMYNLNTFAFKISADSKEEEKKVPWKSVKELEHDYYQIYKVATALENQFVCDDVTKWGIYLYDIDKVISSGRTLPLEQLINDMEKQFKNKERLKDFFNVECYLPGEKFFYTGRVEGHQGCYLLVGICIEIGADKDKGLIYFLVSADDIENSTVIFDEQGMEFYLLEKTSGQAVLAWGDHEGSNIEDVSSREPVREVAGRRHKVLYKKDCSYTDFAIAVYISENAMQNSMIDYAHYMRKLLLVAMIVLTCLCGGAIYLAYTPVYKLTAKLGNLGGDEFSGIRNMLSEGYNKIQEQEMLIMDLLINHLIYGVHVSEKKIKRLGVDTSIHFYCVIFLKDYVLANWEKEQLVDSVERECYSRLFVTDWQGENNSVLILFSQKEDVSESVKHIDNWLEKNCVDSYEMYVGKTTERLDAIQMSLRSCFEQMKKKQEQEEREQAKSEADNAKEERQRKLKEDILSYLDKHYREEDLNQAQVSDIFRISTYTLSRLFKNQIGVGFSEYLVAKRIEYARELLLTTTHSVNEIATMSGFSSGNHFSKSFKMYVGVSPTVFRKQI